MITIGPFRISELEQIQGLLNKHEIAHEAFADEELRDQLMAQFHQSASTRAHAGGHLDLRYIFFEVEPSAFEKAREELEKLGITPPSDGSFELGED